jgi:hypothetical protein
MKLKLGQKLLLTTAVIIVIAITTIFWWLIGRERKIFLREIKQQARAYFKQIVLVRHWIADHGGVYVLKKEGVETNPYLKKIPGLEPDIVDSEGNVYTLLNPAVATRELSEYAEREGMVIKFRLTSLKLLNPDNAPTDFERRALLSFEQGQKEAFAIEDEAGIRVYRYMAPLYVKESCLKCHGQLGYKVGDLRGGISVTIPIQTWESDLKRTNIIFISAAIFITLIIIGLFYLLVTRLISKPLELLKHTTKNITTGGLSRPVQLKTGNEIESLAAEFRTMAENLNKSYLELEEASHTLEKTQEHLGHCERLTTMGTVVAGVAHELGNPLSNIMYELEDLRDSLGKLDEETQNSFTVLDEELHRINQIIHQLQGVTRASAEEWEAIDINKLLDSKIFSIFFGELRLKNIEIELKLDKTIPPIKGSKTQITQVLINLIRNAENAIADGGKLEISTRSSTFKDKTTSVEIEISDNGCGIPPEKLPHIFEPFFTTKGAMGSGLGLFISYKIIQDHQGGIKVHSELNKGTTFIIELPAVLSRQNSS